MKHEKQSFTLIEILIVIVIIGILSSFIFFTINDSVEKAQITKSKMFSESIRNNLFLNLVSEWTFDNGSGIVEYTKILDTWSSNNATEIGGDPQFKTKSECVTGTCVEFDGNDWIYFNNDQGLNPKTHNWSLSIWIKTNQTSASNGGYIRLAGKCCSYPYWLIRHHSNSTPAPVLQIVDASGHSASVNCDSAYNVSDNKWHFLYYVYNKTTGETYIYIDGKKNCYRNWGNEGVIMGDINALKEFKIVNVNHSSEIYTGLIDTISIFSDALSESKIKQNYLAGLNSLLAQGTILKTEYNKRINELAYE